MSTGNLVVERKRYTLAAREGEGLWASGWLDTDGTMRELRVKLEPYIAESEGNLANARTIFTVLDRIQRGVSDGSLPTLLRLHRFLSPFLSSPSRPFLLDDILTIHRWRIVLPPRT